MLQGVKIFDGGFGSELQKRGMKAGEVPEELNITHPEIITDIHKAYVKAGCDYITCNSFGLNPIKMKDSKYSVKEMAEAAISCAKKLQLVKKLCLILDLLEDYYSRLEIYRLMKHMNVLKRLF